MKKARFTTEQIIAIPQERAAGAAPAVNDRVKVPTRDRLEFPTR